MFPAFQTFRVGCVLLSRRCAGSPWFFCWSGHGRLVGVLDGLSGIVSPSWGHLLPSRAVSRPSRGCFEATVLEPSRGHFRTISEQKASAKQSARFSVKARRNFCLPDVLCGLFCLTEVMYKALGCSLGSLGVLLACLWAVSCFLAADVPKPCLYSV